MAKNKSIKLYDKSTGLAKNTHEQTVQNMAVVSKREKICVGRASYIVMDTVSSWFYWFVTWGDWYSKDTSNASVHVRCNYSRGCPFGLKTGFFCFLVKSVFDCSFVKFLLLPVCQYASLPVYRGEHGQLTHAHFGTSIWLELNRTFPFCPLSHSYSPLKHAACTIFFLLGVTLSKPVYFRAWT